MASLRGDAAAAAAVCAGVCAAGILSQMPFSGVFIYIPFHMTWADRVGGVVTSVVSDKGLGVGVDLPISLTGQSSS